MGRIGRPTKDEALALVEGLLDHAGRAFVRDGYRATTIEAVAAAADVSKKTIYAQFGDKAGLFRAVFQKIAAERGKFLILGDPGPGREGLIRRGTVIVEGAFEAHTVAFNRLLMREGAEFPELQQITQEITRVHVIEPLTIYLRREFPEIPPEHLQFLAESFINLLLGRYVSLVSQADHGPLRTWYTEQRIADVCDLFLAGCAALNR